MLDRFSYGSVWRISSEALAAVINLDRVEEAVGGAGIREKRLGTPQRKSSRTYSSSYKIVSG